ncbi:MAG TPA: GFA family protein [Steroidobacteraceae bacterium]|nr:GFA family protein [Steroidobacteraceae bacterium]
MSYAGRCACGAVKLQIVGEPVAIRQCWCRQCQHMSGGGPTHNAMFRTGDVRIEGELAGHGYLADSGNQLTQWFCPACGNPVYAQSSARLQFRTVRLGVLDQPHDLKPTMAIWTESAPPWAVIDPTLDQFPRQPPPPPGSK